MWTWLIPMYPQSSGVYASIWRHDRHCPRCPKCIPHLKQSHWVRCQSWLCVCLCCWASATKVQYICVCVWTIELYVHTHLATFTNRPGFWRFSLPRATWRQPNTLIASRVTLKCWGENERVHWWIHLCTSSIPITLTLLCRTECRRDSNFYTAFSKDQSVEKVKWSRENKQTNRQKTEKGSTRLF